MKTCLITITLILISLPSHADIAGSDLRNLFSKGQAPSSSQANLKWKCFMDNDSDPGGNNCGNDYGLKYENGNFVVPKFGLAKDNPKNLDTSKNALVFSQKDNEGDMAYLSVRSIVTPNGPRLVMEESSSSASWQKADKKSVTTGFTPHLYQVCVPEEEFIKFLKSAAPAKIGEKADDAAARK